MNIRSVNGWVVFQSFHYEGALAWQIIQPYTNLIDKNIERDIYIHTQCVNINTSFVYLQTQTKYIYIYTQCVNMNTSSFYVQTQAHFTNKYHKVYTPKIVASNPS